MCRLQVRDDCMVVLFGRSTCMKISVGFMFVPCIVRNDMSISSI